MRLHLIGVSALVSAMETENLLRHPGEHPASNPSHLGRYLEDSLTDWLPQPDAPQAGASG